MWYQVMLTMSVTKAGAAVCLAGLIYYLIATRIADMLKLPGEADKKDEDYPALKRKKVSTVSYLSMQVYSIISDCASSYRDSAKVLTGSEAGHGHDLPLHAYRRWGRPAIERAYPVSCQQVNDDARHAVLVVNVL
jgi:hypothetical protein